MALQAEIAVIGGGVAGLAAAGLLAGQGQCVTVFEQSPRPGPVGAGLLLQPTGLAVLDRLGIGETMRALGAPVHRLHGRTLRGRVVLDLAYADLKRGGASASRSPHGLGVHRGALFGLLHARALGAGASLISGARVEGVSDDGGRWRLVGQGLGEHAARAFDLVVVADGARSAVRGSLCPRARARAYPWGALWFVATDAGGAFAGALRQVYRGTRGMVGWLPTGRAGAGGDPTVSVFWSVPVRAMDAVRQGEIGPWRREVLALAPELEPLVAQVPSMRELISAVYMDVDCPLSPRPGIVVLGDAAHATSPQLGQGANLALLDAWALAEGLERYPLGGCGDVDDRATRSERLARERAALGAWMEQRRRGSIRFYQRASRWLTPWFQSGLSPLAGPRDLLMGPVSRIGWVRQQMLLSLAGVKTGLLSAGELGGDEPGPEQ